MAEISDIRIAPPTGERKVVMVFFHGYGSNGAAMASHVGETIAPSLDGVVMRFPDGPLRAGNDAFLKSWFEIEDMLHDKEACGKPFDGNLVPHKAAQTLPQIHDYLDRVIEQEGITPDQLIIAGFSQGATIAFYSALQRQEQVGGVVSISGPAIDQVWDINSRPKIFLMAGADEHSYFSGRQVAEKTHYLLQAHNFDSSLYLTPDNEHDIDGNTMTALARFIVNVAEEHQNACAVKASPARPFSP